MKRWPIVRFSSLASVVFVVFFSASLIYLVNRFAPQGLPDDPRERIAQLVKANRYEQAASLYRQLLNENPGDLTLHTAYLQLSDSPTGPSKHEALVSYYRELSAQDQTRDIGLYGLGMIEHLEKNYAKALDFYGQVTNQKQKFLHLSIGKAYQELGNQDAAKAHFQDEIHNGGDVQSAVSQLAALYIDASQLNELKKLTADGQTAQYLSLNQQRWVAYQSGDLVRYLTLTFIEPYKRLTFVSVLSALAICLVWIIFLWRVNLFKQDSLISMVIVLGLGMVAAMSIFLLTDILRELIPLNLGESWQQDLLHNVVYIGLLEELVKFLPVVIIFTVFRRIQEPFDLVIYGSLSALGFATLENAMYFSTHGLDIAYLRFLISTVMHLGMTSLVCYAWVRVLSSSRGKAILVVILGLSFAALVHGLYDFFFISSGADLSILSIAILLIMAREYHRMIKNSLSLSPIFIKNQPQVRQLTNFGLFFSGALLILTIVYLYNNFTYSNEVANQQLTALSIYSLPAVLAVFGSLGSFSVVPGKITPILFAPRLLRRPTG